MRLSPLSLSLLLALGGCSLAPALPKPALPVPDTYGAAPAGEAAEKSADASAAAIGWRRMFGDPRLQRLIEVALEHNRDLRLAVLNVSQVQAQYDIQRSYRVPGVDAGLEGSRQRSSSDGGNSTAIQETRSA
ncbi:MAG: RND transporter, partial [Azospira oryzae]